MQPLKVFVPLAVIAIAPASAFAACNIYNGQAYGDCSGVTINRSPAPYKTVRGSESLAGISRGATVESGGSLSASGIVDRIVVKRGARADIRGIANYVRNEGGIVDISGQVSQMEALAGTTTITGMVGSLTGQGKIVKRSGSVIAGTPTP